MVHRSHSELKGHARLSRSILFKAFGVAVLVSLFLVRLQGLSTATPSAATPIIDRNTIEPTLAALLEAISVHAEIDVPREGAGWWTYHGHIAQVPNEVQDFAAAAALPGINTICEVGFNAGHSAAVFLTANPHATFYAFDLMEYPYAERMVKYMKRIFGDRLHVVKGLSSDTLPWFRTQNITCDIFSIDGDHNYDGALRDFVQAVKIMSPGALLIADDVSPSAAGVLKAWEDLNAHGYVVNKTCDSRDLGHWFKRWCIGTVLKSTGDLDSTFDQRGRVIEHPTIF